jgi:hypothetical protein
MAQTEIWIRFYDSEYDGRSYQKNNEDNIEVPLSGHGEFLGTEIRTGTHRFHWKEEEEIFWISVWGKPAGPEYMKSVTIRNESGMPLPKGLIRILKTKGFQKPEELE